MFMEYCKRLCGKEKISDSKQRFTLQISKRADNQRINNFTGLLLFSQRVFDNKDVFSIFFHEVALTGKFFQGGGITLNIL